MKRICLLLAIVLVLSLVSVAFGCAGKPAAEQTFTLKISHSGAPGPTSMKHLWATKIKELIEERTKGRVTVELYPAAQLYADKDALVAVSKGEIFGINTTTGDLSQWQPKLDIFDLYGLFVSYDHAREFHKSKLLQKQVFDPMKERGMQVTMQLSPYLHSFTKKEIKSVADYKGLKLRVIPSKAQLAGCKAIGADPVPLSIAELYTALQQGTVDGAITLELSIFGRSLQEVVKYCVNDPVFSVLGEAIVLSTIQLEKLPSDIRKTVEQANVEAIRAAEDTYFANELKVIHQPLISAGMAFNKLSDTEKAKFLEASKASWTDLAPTIGQDLIDEALKLRPK